MIAATQSNHPLATVSDPAPAGSAMNEARERILACNDIHQLETWLDRASVAGRVEDVLNGH